MKMKFLLLSLFVRVYRAGLSDEASRGGGSLGEGGSNQVAPSQTKSKYIAVFFRLSVFASGSWLLSSGFVRTPIKEKRANVSVHPHNIFPT
jgi:hypothetical protein